MSSSLGGSRLKNSKRNVYSGMVKQLVNMLFAFGIRTALIYLLGAEYQGLNGLFSSILQVLNLSELGFSAAVTFILYKPIAEEDTDSIKAIMGFLRKIYRIFGVIILGVGLVIMPFVPRLISGTVPKGINIYLLFAIHLINTVVSYMMFSYKSTLLIASQREDVVSNIYTITSLVSKLVQILLLVLFRNYYLFVIILPICSIINNILLEVASKKLYPYFFPAGRIDEGTRQIFIKQVKAALLNRVSDIARNSLNNIILSSYLGLVIVAAYDNYYYIYAAVYGIMGVIVHGVQASIGNSLVQESVEKNYQDCLKFNFMFMWIVGWCAITMSCLYQPFMHIWMKGNNELVLSDFSMILFCIYFYVISMTYTKGIYLEARGLYWECKYLYIIEIVCNLLLNITFGYYWGISGILISCIMTILLVNFIGGTRILFKCYFKRSEKKFLKEHIKYAAITVMAGSLTHGVCCFVSLHGFFEIIVKLCVCIVIPNVVYCLFYCKKQEFKSSIQIVRRLIR